MNVISPTGSGLLDRLGASRATIAQPADASTSRPRASPATALSTRVTLGQRNDNSPVYTDPRATPGFTHVWSSPPGGKDDNISALMARNRGTNSYQLGDQWRGLGGAMLARFGQTGDNFTQTLVDDFSAVTSEALDALPAEERAQRAADVLAKQKADLGNVEKNASTAGMKIQTRSGQAVELKIAVNTGSGSVVGMKVELTASAAMSPAERAAIEQLASGLDRALEGLGRDDAVDLDLSGLMNYDRGVIASIDLAASNNRAAQVLGTFDLHLGDDRQSVSLKGSDGEINLDVGTGTPLGNTPAPQRRAAIQRTLDRLDSAGDRGHATAALVEQMKSAFTQFQLAATQADGDTDDGQADASSRSAPAAADADIAANLSGLADFDATFSGETRRSNRFGTTHEAGHAEYQLGQKTTTRFTRDGVGSVTQTVSAQLSADFRRAAGADTMLDVRNGNFSTSHVRDSSTVTTLVESAANGVIRALRKTDEHQLKTVTDLERHRIVHRQSWPSQRSSVERLH